jgi:glucokinase
MILAGDLGGTKSNLGLFDGESGKLVRASHKRYASREHAGLQEIAKDFLNGAGGKVTAACFGIAGPVVNNRVHATNMPWIIDGAAMASFLGLQSVRLINDVEATAYGIGVLEPADMEAIYPGAAGAEGTRVVIAAGTGLGEATLYWDGKRYVIMPMEPGHADFSPHTDQQADLWKNLKKNNEFVSAEMILGGSGFQRVHEFLDPTVRHPGFDDKSVDPAPGITERGLSGECPVCVKTLELWIDIYGSEAGNLAVRTVARGGIYVAGGIALKILPKLRDARFAATVRDKEKLTDFLAAIPIRVVLNEECPLLGAAYVAWKCS